MSDLPVVTTEIALVNNPGDTSLTWEDVSDSVDSFAWARGRQNDIDRFEAGTAEAVLINDDRRFDPTYTSGPYYGYLVPMRRIRVTALWDGVTYPIFSGFVDGWPQQYTGDGFLTYVPLRCTDLFKSLSFATITASYPSETSGSRIGRILDALAWPAGDRDIDTGQSTLQAATLVDANALLHLQDVNNSENGLLFLSRDGKVTFVDRHALILAPQDTSLVWGDADPELPYTAITIDPDDSNLHNDWSVTADGLTTQTASDATSIGRYLKRSASRATLLSGEPEMSDLAYFLLSRFKDPQTRIVGMEMDGLPADSVTLTQNFTAILGREIGDKIRVRRRPTGGGNTIEQDSVIEAIAGRITGRSFQFSFNLSPADATSNYWVLGDAVQSVLGTTTKLAY